MLVLDPRQNWQSPAVSRYIDLGLWGAMSPSGLECTRPEGGRGECPQKDPSWLSSHLLPRWVRAQYSVFIIIHLFLVSEYSVLPWQGTTDNRKGLTQRRQHYTSSLAEDIFKLLTMRGKQGGGLERSREAEVASLEKQKAQELREAVRWALVSYRDSLESQAEWVVLMACWEQVSLKPETFPVAPKQTDTCSQLLH